MQRNRVEVAGYLGKDAQARYLPTGTKVVNLRLAESYTFTDRVAVGTLVAQSPPHRSVRADFPHTALILDVWRQSVHSDTGAESVAMEATGWPEMQSAPRSRAAADLDGVLLAARVA
jgi:hypothetical protein